MITISHSFQVYVCKFVMWSCDGFFFSFIHSVKAHAQLTLHCIWYNVSHKLLWTSEVCASLKCNAIVAIGGENHILQANLHQELLWAFFSHQSDNNLLLQIDLLQSVQHFRPVVLIVLCICQHVKILSHLKQYADERNYFFLFFLMI